MHYAVVTIGGHQYVVHEGQELEVQKLPQNEGETFVIEKVHMVFDENGNEVKIGAPFVSGVKILASKQKEFRDTKVMVVKFKPKIRYHKRVGHRQTLNRLKIEKIERLDI